MMRNYCSLKHNIVVTFILFFVVIFFCSCGGGAAEAVSITENGEPSENVSPDEAQTEYESEKAEVVDIENEQTTEIADEVAEVPEESPASVIGSLQPASEPAAEFKDSVYDETAADGSDGVYLDLSHSAEGYFGVHSDSSKRIKIQVVKGDDEYIYDAVEGEDVIFPFQCGDGDYNIRVMQNVEGSKYFELFDEKAEVKLLSEFEPFLRPSRYADYSIESDCVKKAAEMFSCSSGEMDFISKVYSFVCENVTYDDDKAENVKSGYMPDPDETLETGKGICFDYAALTASMLRSQGVPTKLIFGYVGKDELYHAWNMFYTEEEGWITVEFKAVPNEWNRVDLTFYANGADSTFIGDGTNYVDIYQY